MFYCEECRKAKQWPDSLMESYGECEVCKKTKPCWDRPSSSLPRPAKVPPFHVALGLTLGREIQKKLRDHEVYSDGTYEKIQALPEAYQEAIRFITSTELAEVLELAERNA